MQTVKIPRLYRHNISHWYNTNSKLNCVVALVFFAQTRLVSPQGKPSRYATA
jgi:hypothetical protein